MEEGEGQGEEEEEEEEDDALHYDCSYRRRVMRLLCTEGTVRNTASYSGVRASRADFGRDPSRP